MLHNYHLYFDYLLKTVETEKLYIELETLTNSMLEKSLQQYNKLEGTEWENASKRNVAFFSVAAKLLNPKAEIPDYVSKEVNQELELIDKHSETFLASPVMNLSSAKGDSNSSIDTIKEDYTQYNPRGHYNKSSTLKKYFKTMMWYGRMNFRTAMEDETKSAALITLLLGSNEVYKNWNTIYEPTSFLVGKSDDLGFYEYYKALDHVYGKIPNLDEVTKQNKLWDLFCKEVKNMDMPKVNSIPIYDANIQPDKEEAIKGFRFMGQRFTIDAAVFQKLIYREVEENNNGEMRTLPKALDLTAAMGSEEAYNILTDMGEIKYKGYAENMKELKDNLAKLDSKTNTQNLYWSWLYMLKPLTETKGEGYPAFMKNSAWTRKQLETYLGSWTELKHDTVLYGKQAYAEMGGGDEPEDDRGYVEPNPEVYARLAALTRLTIDGMGSRQLLNETINDSLLKLEELALKLKTISEKELENKSLNEEEYELIRSYGGQLEHFWFEALKDEGVDGPSAAWSNPAALVTDVATDTNGQRVLQEATGYINDIYVIVPIDGKLRIAKGGVYSYYEFPWEQSNRLTDEEWKTMLQQGNIPKAPGWTKLYTAESSNGIW